MAALKRRVINYRQQILSLYAQQLDKEELQKLAAACESMSGRDLRDVCEQAERRTASQVLPALSLQLPLERLKGFFYSKE